MTETDKHRYWLYVLNLEQNKKYVGITSKTPELRMRQHQNEFLGAAWTKRYKPIEIFDQRDLGFMTYQEAQRYENKVVRAYIKKYGYQNVRGGDISTSADLVRRFGYYWNKEDWSVFTMGVALVLLMILQTILYYAK